MDKQNTIHHFGEVKRVTVVTGGTNQPTVSRELEGEELRLWKVEHGYTTEVQTESDPE